MTTMLAIALAALSTAAPKPSTADIVQRSWDETLVVGHRGAAAYKPENTLPSFEEAISSGAVATECDVHLSQDRQMAVMHDKTLDRTTSLKGAVKDTPMAAMSAAGVPTLQELAKLTKDRIVLVVEIKRGTLTRVRPDGTHEIVAEVGQGPNGAAIGPDGAMYVCNNGNAWAWTEDRLLGT